jgi:elongation factor G
LLDTFSFDYSFERDLAGEKQFARVSMKVESIPFSAGVQFLSNIAVNQTFTVPFLKAIEQGFREAMEVGPLASYSMVGLKGTLVSIETRPQESNEMAFKAAVSIGLRQKLREIRAELLEPIMKLEVMCPDDFVGNIVGDLNSRRGKIHSMSVRPGGGQIISAEAPLVNLFGYATDIRSLSQGRASFSMEFQEYSIIPLKVKNEILAKMGR